MRFTSTKKYYTGIILFAANFLLLIHPALANKSVEEESGPVIAGVVINSCIGSITISVTSGTAPYTYAWEDSGGNSVGTNSFIVTGLGPDNYTVTVTDDNGDDVTATYTVTNPPDLVGTVVVNNVTCRGDSDAQVIVTMTNGNPDYTWELFNSGGGSVQTGTAPFPSNVITIGGLGVDSYTLEVEDDDGCTGTITFNITEPAQFLGANLVDSQDATCSNSTDGRLEVVGTGGWGGYTYAWFDASSNFLGNTSVLTGLLPGDYTVVITDSNGCQVSPTYTIDGPAAITNSSSVNHVTCNSGTDGSIDITPAGGNGTFSYLWTTGATTQDVSGLAAGTYGVTITDIQGCTYTESFTITEPAILAINESITDVSCHGGSDGSITSNVSGGTGPYTYLWSTGATGANLIGLSAGSYDLTVTDANGCQTMENFIITEPASPLTVDGFVPTLPTCFGGNDGSLQVNVSGGTAPYTYAWNSGATTATATGLSSGTQAVTITDANGCVVVGNFTLNDPVAISVATTISIPSCNGGADGSITASASNGTGPYTYNWNTGDVGPTINSLTAGTYVLTVTDAGGCSIVENVVVGEPNPIVSNAAVNDISCNGLSDGNIALAVTGGTAPYTYLWSTGATGSSVTNLSAGNYSVTITDDNGCTAIDNFAIIDPAPIGSSLTQTDVLCRGNATGAIDLTPSGGTLPYTYLWSNGATTQDLNSLVAGTYSVTITDASGCTTTANTTITEPATALQVTGVETHATCNGSTNGEIDITITGGIAPYTVLWNNGMTTEDITALASGNYSVQVTDANGCVSSTNFTITEPTPLVATPTVTDITCFGDDDGRIDISVSGGTAPYTYSWADGPTVKDRTALTPGNYTLTTTDANGCQNVQVLTINEPAVLATSVVKQDVNCFGESTGIINLTVTGGTAPYTYLWSDGNTLEDRSSLAAGNYDVTVTDANGCTSMGMVTITEPASALSFTSVVQQITCNGAADGIINLTVSGGTAPYSFNWSNGSSSEDLSNLPAAVYNVTITDALGCTAGGSFTITDPPVLSVSGVENDVSCFGIADGSIDLTVSGGEGPYTYMWAHGPATEDVSGLGPGSYSVQVTDVRGCSQLSAFTITEPTALGLSHIATDVNCFGGSDGSIDLTVTGGTGPYSYVWSNGSNAEDLNSLTTGNYMITVTDANGCSISETINIDQPSAALFKFETVTDVTCNGFSDGRIDIAVSGGTLPYSYSWNDGSTTQDRLGLSPGTYVLTITDANGCQLTDSYTITQPDALSTTLSVDQVSCFGTADGEIDLTVSGGTGAYNYLWSDGVTTEDRSGLAPGTYTVIITDDNGCQVNESVTITQPDALVINEVVTDISCFGDAGGAIDITVSGGTAPYVYSWSSGEITEDLTGLLADTYTVTVTDANGCTLNKDITVDQPAQPLTINEVVNDITCFGAADGNIQLNVSGGTAPFTYAWGHGATTENIAGLLVGNYAVTVTDANGCTTAGNFTIDSPAAILANAVVQDLDCNNAGNGAIDLTVSGGTAPLSFSWSNGATTEDLSGIDAGDYTVVITDANGCSLNRMYTVTEPLALQSSGIVTDVQCFGEGDGAIQVSVTGGISPYTYQWSNGAVTEDLFNIDGGSYSLTITDANGCQIIENFTVSEPVSALSISGVVNDVNCFGANNGSITTTINGGTGPYVYSWNQGAITQNLSGQGPGSYQLTVTDANGCSLSESFTIEGPDMLQVSTSVDNLTCYEANDGAIDLAVTGGTGPYNFSWAHGPITEDLSGLSAGTYQVIITDANGCSINRSYTVTEPLALQASGIVADVQCFGAADGAIQVNVTGGVTPYTYQWSNGAVTEDLNNIGGGNYTLTVTDANGCQIIENFTVTEPVSALNISGVVSDVSCFGANSGSVTTTVSGGTGPYVYSWNQGAITQNLSGQGPGTYRLTVTDANGCSASELFTIEEPDVLQVNTSVDDLTCFGANDGTIDLTVAGGTGPYTFSWAHGPVTEDLNGLSAGTYQVIITDANGCAINRSYTVTEPLALQASGIVADVQCFGGNDGAIQVNVTGGVTPYTYQWSNGAVTEDLNNIVGGNYALTVTDANGCVVTESFTVAEPVSALNISGVVSDVSCFGANNGSVTTTISGGTGPYVYSWNQGAITQNLSGQGPGTYRLTVTDANGCSASELFTIEEPDVLQVNTSVDNLTCFGANDGTIDLTVAGGTGPYTFSWAHGPVTEDLSGLLAGTYQVVIADANGCSLNETITVQQPAELALAFDANDVDCFGENDGSIDLTVTGGTFPFTYAWSDGSTSEDLFALYAGSYAVTVTDANGCSISQTITITEPAAALSATATSVDVTCSGGSDGQIDLSVAGGTLPYSYSWNTGATTEDISGLLPGTYQVTVTDNNGCEIILDYTISAPQPLAITGAVTDISCRGAADGAVNLTVSGGTAPYTYAWSNGQNSQDISGLDIGDVSVLVTDANGCTTTGIYTITQPLDLVVNHVVSDVTCFDADDGSIDLTITGGTAPYSYEWSNGATTQDIQNLAGGAQTVRVLDARGCQVTAVILVEAPSAPLAASPAIQDVGCNGSPSGRINLTVTGGTGPYSYEWSNGSSQPNLLNVFAGSYEVIVTDQKGCVFTATYEVTEPEPVTATFDITNTSCFGDADGAISVATEGGTGPYSYIWSNGSTSRDQVNLRSGTYNVTITDANGCSIVRSATVGDARDLTLEIRKTDVLCQGEASGAIDLTVSGGSGNYSFEWSNGQQVSDLTGLNAGIYEVLVSDDGGCSTSASVVISEPAAALDIRIDQSPDFTCFGQSNGFARVVPRGGVAPYAYLWSNGARTSEITDIPAGEYTVNVTDANGCSVAQTFRIGQPEEPITLIASGNLDLACRGNADGKIELAVTGGTAPYTYLWSTGSDENTIEDLVAGNYTVRVVDALGCVMEQSFIVQQPDELRIVNAFVNESQCFDDRNGSIELDIVGGTGPYQYQWSNGATSRNIIGISSGTYSVVVTDDRGCSVQASYELADPALFRINPEISEISCIGANDASISLNIEGGVGDKVIRWNTGQVGETLTNLSPGQYNVTITDENECSLQQTFNIIEPLPVTLDAFVQDAIECGNPSSGQINLIVSGGRAPYTYRWSNGATNQLLTDLFPGTYAVTVTDRFGCTATGTYSVQQPDPLKIGLRTQLLVNCETRTIDNRVTAEVSGGFGGYEFEWSRGGSRGSEIIVSEPGRLTLKITDDNGCTLEKSVDIAIPELGEADFDFTSESIMRDGEAAANDPVSFFDDSFGDIIDWAWDFGDGFDSREVDPIHTYDAPGTYTVNLVVTDGSGCTSLKTQIIEITEGYRVMVPDAFTPNGDGNNDFFRPRMLGLEKVQLLIFNTWGELIFNTDDVETPGWDGTIRGKPAENGNYIYKLVGQSFNGLRVERDGVFALIK